MAKIAFVEYFWMEKLGLMYISSVLKKHGHQTLICMNDRPQMKKRLLKFKPDVVGLQYITGMHEWVRTTADFVKNQIGKDVLVAAGGPHPTFFPETIEHENNIDIICRGEGEYPMLELADALDAGRDTTGIKNLWVKKDGKVFKNPMRPLLQDLDELPPPDRELYRDYKFIFEGPYHHFMTSRGCLYDCTFCYNHIFREMQDSPSGYMRRRSVDSVMGELSECKRSHRMKSVIFLDDNFTMADRGWLFSFLDRYKSDIGIPFFCLLRANLIDEEAAEKLKDSGCYWVTMGVETGNEDYRNSILKKSLKDSEITEAARLLHKYNIRFNTANMLGLPNETVEDAVKTLRFNSRLKPSVAWCCLFQPYPKTALGEYCLKEGLIDRLDGSCIDVHSHTSSPLKQKDIRQIENLHKFSHIAVMFPALLPLIRRLIRLPPNKAFLYIYRITYLIFYWSRFNKINVKRALEEAGIALKFYKDNN